MNNKELTIRLIKLDKTKKDLLEEVRTYGYPKLAQTQLYAYITRGLLTPQAEAVLKVIDIIIAKWEKEAQG